MTVYVDPINPVGNDVADVAEVAAWLDGIRALKDLLEGVESHGMDYLFKPGATWDFEVQLGDAGGVQKVIIRDSGGVAVASIDSNGIITMLDGILTGHLDMTEIAPPGNPAANTLRLFVEDVKGFSFFSFRDENGMIRKIVRDSVFVGKNITGVAISAMRAVYATGSADNVPTLGLAKADAAATMPAIGVTIEAIADGAYGRVMQVGLLEGVNTNAFNAGDVIYVSAATAGDGTATPPIYPNMRQEIGTVLVKGVAGVGVFQCVARSVFNDALIDHGALIGLGDDDHPQYMTPAEHTAIGDGVPHHAPVTIGVDGEHSVAGQVLSGVDAAAAQKGHIQLTNQLGGTAALPDVRGLRETAGPTLLTMGAVADGEFLRRNGAVVEGAAGAGADPDAIHDNVAGEIAAIAEKAAPVDADVFVIEDSEAGNAKKKVQIGNLPGGGGGATIWTTAYGAPPAAADGDLWLPTNSFYGLRYNGAAFIPWGPIFPMTPPVDPGTWDNQDSSTIVTTNGGLFLKNATATDGYNVRYKNAPATPWTVRMAFLPLLTPNNLGFSCVGFCFRESATGKLHTFALSQDGGTTYLEIQKWTNSTTYSDLYFRLGNPIGMYALLWLEIADDGTNRKCRVGADGVNLLQVHTIERTDFLTADQWGICIRVANTTGAGLTVLSLAEL